MYHRSLFVRTLDRSGFASPCRHICFGKPLRPSWAPAVTIGYARHCGIASRALATIWHWAHATNATSDKNSGEPWGVPLLRRRAIIAIPSLFPLYFSHTLCPMGLNHNNVCALVTEPGKVVHISVTLNADTLVPRVSHTPPSIPYSLFPSLGSQEPKTQSMGPRNRA
jgi:hypothetical protein